MQNPAGFRKLCNAQPEAQMSVNLEALPMDTMTKPMLSIREFAAETGLSESMTRRLAIAGYLNAVRIGSKLIKIPAETAERVKSGEELPAPLEGLRQVGRPPKTRTRHAPERWPSLRGTEKA
jgi:hypothetical protein